MRVINRTVNFKAGNFDTFIKFKNPRNRAGYYSYDDIGMAQRIVDVYRGKFIYVIGDDIFYFWNGTVWQPDKKLMIKQCFNSVMEALPLEPPHADDSIGLGGSESEAKRKFIVREHSHAGKKNAIEEIKPLVPVEAEMLDADESLINTPTGVLKADFNARKIHFVPHNSDFLLTKITNGSVSARPYEGSRWQQFLNEVFLGDLETIEFVQRAVGYSLFGHGKNQLMFVLFGDDKDDSKNGSNGKSVFLNAISNALGDYAWKMNPDSIIAGRKGSNGSSATPDIVALKGKRFVTTSELENGAKLDEAFIKSLFSGEPINARRLYRENINFMPIFTLWLSTNYKPKVDGTDDGIWRRLVYIPFLAKFSATSQPKIDINLPAKLDAERDIIFRWIIEGAQKYLEDESNRLIIPQQIKKIGEMEMKRQDVVAWFVSECIELTDDQNDCLKSAAIKDTYLIWAKANNVKMTAETFLKHFRESFSDRYKRRSNSRYYIGMKLSGN